jgi:hypothetical protein
MILNTPGGGRPSYNIMVHYGHRALVLQIEIGHHVRADTRRAALSIPVIEIRIDAQRQATGRRVVSVAASISEAEELAAKAAARHPTRGFDDEKGHWWAISAEGINYLYCRQ